MSNSIGTIGVNDLRDPISEWRVVIPSETDREVYISNCYLTSTISIGNANGEVLNGVRIGKLCLQLVDFPDTESEFGSDVVCVKAPYSSLLYVVDVFNTARQYLHQRENQYRFVKSHEGGSASAVIDGRGNILLTVDGYEEDGNLSIRVTNKERKGKLSVNVNGTIDVQNDGQTKITSSESFTAIYKKGEESSSVLLNSDGVLINSKKIQLNESEEPVLLGQKTVDLISELLDLLGKDSAGPYPLVSNAKYIQLKGKLKDIKSTISFVK